MTKMLLMGCYKQKYHILFQAASVEDVPPIIPTPHHYLINIYRNQLYYVAVVTTEGKRGTMWENPVP